MAISRRRGRNKKRMYADRYLRQIRVFKIKIKQKREELEMLKDEARSVSGIRYDDERVQTSPTGDALEKKIIRCTQLTDEIDRMFDQYLATKDLIINQIQDMSDEKHMDVLFQYYVQMKGIEEIAKEMEYSGHYIKELKGKALEEFQRKYIIPTNSH